MTRIPLVHRERTLRDAYASRSRRNANVHSLELWIMEQRYKAFRGLTQRSHAEGIAPIRLPSTSQSVRGVRRRQNGGMEFRSLNCGRLCVPVAYLEDALGSATCHSTIFDHLETMKEHEPR